MDLTRIHVRDYLMHGDERAVYHAYPRHIAENLNSVEVLKERIKGFDRPVLVNRFRVLPGWIVPGN